MNLVHIIVGDFAAKNLQEAITLDESMSGDIIVLKDTLGIGPLYTPENTNYTDIRKAFWQQLMPQTPIEEIDLQDEENILQIIANKNDDTQVWFWMAPCISDHMAYFWLLPYFQKHTGLLSVININALPFFNEKGLLYYPNNFSMILPKEVIKCKRLAKPVSAADYEIDLDEWIRLSGENAMIRVYEGNKKISSKNETHFDYLIQNAASADFQKANKIVHQALSKNTQTVSDLFLNYRLKRMIEEGKLETNGDTSKSLKDFEVKKINKQEESQEVVAQPNN